MSGSPRATRCGRASTCALLLWIAASSLVRASSNADAGGLAGTVAVGPELSARRVSFSLYADPNRARRTSPASLADEVQNVVVYLEPIDPTTATPGAPVEASRMEQFALSFSPHVLAVPRGATVEFPNRDVVFHNVFSLSKVASFDLGRYPSGASKSVRFDTPGVVKVFCHIHSDMSAIIVVLDHPYFDQPDRDGRFSIAGIPPGDYRAIPWHERARPVPRQVRIEAGRVANLDFVIPLEVEAPPGG